MTSADTLRNEIIGKLLTISDKSYLSAIKKIVETSINNNGVVNLSQEQKLMLELSNDDIKNGRTVNQTELNKADLKWLNEL